MVLIFINRIFRAIKIDPDLYEEVEHDKSATIQAAGVVVLSDAWLAGGFVSKKNCMRLAKSAVYSTILFWGVWTLGSLTRIYRY